MTSAPKPARSPWPAVNKPAGKRSARCWAREPGAPGSRSGPPRPPAGSPCAEGRPLGRRPRQQRGFRVRRAVPSLRLAARARGHGGGGELRARARPVLPRPPPGLGRAAGGVGTAWRAGPPPPPPPGSARRLVAGGRNGSGGGYVCTLLLRFRKKETHTALSVSYPSARGRAEEAPVPPWRQRRRGPCAQVRAGLRARGAGFARPAESTRAPAGVPSLALVPSFRLGGGDLGRPSRRQYQKCTCLTGRQRPPPPKLEISFAFHSLDSVSLFSSKSSLQVAPVFMWKGPPPLNPYQSGQERYWGGTDVGKCAASCSRLLDRGSPA